MLRRFAVRPSHDAGGNAAVGDSTFTGDREFAFGDQEEMGLGVRLATPLRAEQVSKQGLSAGHGEIVSAEGKRNEAEVWGTAPKWCDYRGEVDGQSAGWRSVPSRKLSAQLVSCARLWVDGGESFGRAAFDQGEPSRVTVAPGEALRLRYGVLVHGRGGRECGPRSRVRAVCGDCGGVMRPQLLAAPGTVRR